jgi:hypothetical protein
MYIILKRCIGILKEYLGKMRCAPNAQSRVAGYFFLGSIPKANHPMKMNGASEVLCTVLKLVAASAAEAELGALFVNAKEANILRLTLEELGHSQPPTPIHTDNSTIEGISMPSAASSERQRGM